MAVNNLKRIGYLSIGIVYFFFNSIFLPEGLLYTAILTPYFLWWLYKQQSLKYIWYFLLVTIPFIPIHLYQGVDWFYYFRSYLLLFTSVVFGISFYISLKDPFDIRFVFKTILLLNFIFMIVALCLLPAQPVRQVFWYLKEISPGTGSVPRLKLFTYEASYYSLLLAPIAIYFYLRLLLLNNRHPTGIFILVTIPLLLSFSLGVWLTLFITFAFLVICYSHVFLQKNAVIKFLLSGLAVGVVGSLILMKYYPTNPLFIRIRNIFAGEDTSFRGRTYEAFILAWKIAEQKSVLFGCGPGQTKIIGVEVFKNYYGYLPPVVRIPNTLADTLATYGLIGLFTRLFFCIYLFFKTKVSRNYYCLALYVFVFIYQFTGSFITNIAEYVIWILAFTPVFHEFNIVKINAAVRKPDHRRLFMLKRPVL